MFPKDILDHKLQQSCQMTSAIEGAQARAVEELPSEPTKVWEILITVLNCLVLVCVLCSKK